MGEAPGPKADPAVGRQRALLKRFEVEESAVRLVNYGRGAIFAIVFGMSGVVIDKLKYPDQLWEFFLLRLVASLLIGGVFVLLAVPSLRPMARLLGHLVAVIPMVALQLMLHLIDESESPYYAGLNLNMVGAVLILRWRASDAAINAALCIGGFLAVSFWNHHDPGHVAMSTFFLLVTGIFACVGLYFYNQLRFQEFCLREEVIEQQEELAENHRQLQKLDESKTQFFANINHELRTPLTLIIAPIEKLRESNAVRNDPALSTLVEALEDNGMRLLRLINDLLDLVRLDSGEMPMRPERFRPSIFIEGLGRNLHPMAERKRINLSWIADCEEDQEVYLDRDRLEKVVLNLAVNALKFTPPSGQVILRVGVVEDRLDLEVSDNGTGMEEDQLDSAFERFWQADPSARKKHRGVGIGLALVKSLTESMHGTIAIRSAPGKGASFTVRVPLVPIPAESRLDDRSGRGEPDAFEEIHERARLHGAIGAVPNVPSPLGAQATRSNAPDGISKREQVLIAENEAGLRRFLRAELESMGCEVIEASDGEEAMQLALQFQPELILADYMMPQRDGISMTIHLRADPRTAQVPIILLTAAASETPRIEALQAGVSDFLTKPFTTAELRLRIRNLLDRQKYQRELGIKNQALNVALEEIKENEARLLQAEKLSSLGRMSAGIVHEVNNPLNYVKTALHTLRVFSADVREEERADFEDTVHDAEEGVNRVIRIVSDLRSFTKGVVAMKEEVKVAEIIEMARRLVSDDLQGIEFEVNVPDEERVSGNSNQLCQVFMNIIQNSAQVLEEAGKRGAGGKVEIRSELAPNGWVSIFVRDNGLGIATEDLEQVFDPFFTKREVGEGMGLGLSICHRILESHHGRIEVESTLGEYTEFRITLPRPWERGLDDGDSDDPEAQNASAEKARIP